MTTERVTPGDDAERFLPPSRPWTAGDDSAVCLIGSRCVACETVLFPPADFCPHCGTAGAAVEHQLSPTGTLFSFTEIHVGRPPFPSRYVVGYVDFPDDVRVLGQVDGTADELQIGDRVQVAVGSVHSSAEAPLWSYRFRKAVDQGVQA